MTTYIDKAACPNGREVLTRCPSCRREFPAVAGSTTEKRELLERDIEARLVKRVKELGGEVRKVQWVGRNSAPDRIVMLPPRVIRRESVVCPGVMVVAADGGGECIWIELKAPGKAATFPKTAHEKAQHREHERMRKMGQRVEVVDSYERIEEILK